LAHGWLQNYRSPQLSGNGAAGSLQEQYTSDSTMTMLALRLRVAYEFERGDYYVKPYVDFDVIYSRLPGYTEKGAGVLALKANSNSQYNIGITPMIEYGTDVVTDGKRRIKAFVSAGVSFLPNNKVSTQMAFVNGLSSAGTYDVTTDGPTILGRFNLGIQAYESESLEVRAQYGLQAGEGYWSQSVSANLLFRF
jgi:outer membrane autotransporter protein